MMRIPPSVPVVIGFVLLIASVTDSESDRTGRRLAERVLQEIRPAADRNGVRVATVSCGLYNADADFYRCDATYEGGFLSEPYTSRWWVSRDGQDWDAYRSGFPDDLGPASFEMRLSRNGS